MKSAKPKRRWLQFSLRSFLLLTLVAALWLGYEVREARQVERTLAGLQALGGNAECEPTGWSLLRLYRVAGYGQRIVRAEIPGAATDEAVELLRHPPYLREVRVIYDGAMDPTPAWRHLTNSLAGVHIVPIASEDDAHFARARSRAVGAYPDDQVLKDFMARRFTPALSLMRYCVCVLADGTLAELFFGEESPVASPGRETSCVVLLVGDECVGAKCFTTSTKLSSQTLVFDDIDHDGIPDVGFQYDDWAGNGPPTHKFPGDSRDWLGVYKIERDGLKPLLPEAKQSP